MASRNQRKKKRTNARNATNAKSDHGHTGQSSPSARSAAGRRGLRSSAETKSSLRTTELIAYVATVLAIIMTALAVDADGQGGADPFGAETALRYITYLTVGYMVARGLAKAGSWRTEGPARPDEQAGAQVSDPEAEPDMDTTSEDTIGATPEPQTNGPSNGEPGAADVDAPDATVHPAGDEVPTRT